MRVDPARRASPAPDIVGAAFGIGAGHTVAEAAIAMRLRVSSARRLAKSVLAKAGVGRQAELAMPLQWLRVGQGGYDGSR